MSKELDCTQYSGADRDECTLLNCALSLVKDLYFDATFLTMNKGSLKADDLWLAMNRPWPGKNTCGEELKALGIDISSCETPP